MQSCSIKRIQIWPSSTSHPQSWLAKTKTPYKFALQHTILKQKKHQQNLFPFLLSYYLSFPFLISYNAINQKRNPDAYAFFSLFFSLTFHTHTHTHPNFFFSFCFIMNCRLPFPLFIRKNWHSYKTRHHSLSLLGVSVSIYCKIIITHCSIEISKCPTMSSISQGLVLATAMVVSSTVLILTYRRPKTFPPPQLSQNQNSQQPEKKILRSCLHSGTWGRFLFSFFFDFFFFLFSF